MLNNLHIYSTTGNNGLNNDNQFSITMIFFVQAQVVTNILYLNCTFCCTFNLQSSIRGNVLPAARNVEARLQDAASQQLSGSVCHVSSGQDSTTVSVHNCVVFSGVLML